MISNWNNSGWLADALYIFPNKSKKYTFEDDLQAKQREKTLEVGMAAKKHLSNLDVRKNSKQDDANDIDNAENFAKSVSKNLGSHQELIKKYQK